MGKKNPKKQEKMDNEGSGIVESNNPDDNSDSVELSIDELEIEDDDEEIIDLLDLTDEVIVDGDVYELTSLVSSPANGVVPSEPIDEGIQQEKTDTIEHDEEDEHSLADADIEHFEISPDEAEPTLMSEEDSIIEASSENEMIDDIYESDDSEAVEMDTLSSEEPSIEESDAMFVESEIEEDPPELPQEEHPAFVYEDLDLDVEVPVDEAIETKESIEEQGIIEKEDSQLLENELKEEHAAPVDETNDPSSYEALDDETEVPEALMEQPPEDYEVTNEEDAASLETTSGKDTIQEESETLSDEEKNDIDAFSMPLDSEDDSSLSISDDHQELKPEEEISEEDSIAEVEDFEEPLSMDSDNFEESSNDDLLDEPSLAEVEDLENALSMESVHLEEKPGDEVSEDGSPNGIEDLELNTNEANHVEEGEGVEGDNLKLANDESAILDQTDIEGTGSTYEQTDMDQDTAEVEKLFTDLAEESEEDFLVKEFMDEGAKDSELMSSDDMIDISDLEAEHVQVSIAAAQEDIIKDTSKDSDTVANADDVYDNTELNDEQSEDALDSLGWDTSQDESIEGIGEQIASATSDVTGLSLSDEQVEKAVERVIEKRFAKKIDAIFMEVIGKTVSEDIKRLKTVIESETKNKA